jgi:hypothetical protein
MATATEQIRAMYPWLPPDALNAYEVAYNAGAVEPWAVVRTDSRYETWFPGNLLDNGEVRHDENRYAGIIEGYDQAFVSIGLQPGHFRDLYADAIRGDVSPDEMYQERVRPIYDRIIGDGASDSIRLVYSQRYGIELTDQAILASALSPSLGVDILEGRITESEIAGEGLESGFAISDQMIEQLRAAKFDRGQADELFSAAANILPTLSVLARRHSDPDDDFSLEDFTNASLQDPTQRRRMRQLVRQEQSQFANTGIANQRDQAGNMSGLEAL